MPAVFRTNPSKFAVERIFAALGTAMVRAQWPPPTDRYTSTPLLFLVGDQDSVVPPAAVEAMARRFAHSEFAVIQGAGHLQGARSDPEGYRASVVGFLTRALG